MTILWKLAARHGRLWAWGKVLEATLVLLLLPGAVQRSLSAPLPEGPEEVLNFCLLDHRGRAYELRRVDARAVVLFFTANGCPVARQSAPKLRELKRKYAAQGVQVFLVNSCSGDDRKSIEQEAHELKLWHIPVLRDDTQGVARHLRIHRTGETVAIGTADWKVFYRGALDDQLVEGAQKPKPTVRHLYEALDEYLAGKPVSVPTTIARGCVIHFDFASKWQDREVSYTQDIVPILERSCTGCHSRGNIGSWPMSNYKKVKSMSSMIEEVLLARRMPPWDADQEVAHYANENLLSVAEAQTLLRWIEQGSPRGEGEDRLEKLRIPPQSDWPLGAPDLVLKLPTPEKIPATGVLDYRHITVMATNQEAGWVGACWVRPGNRKVVHHVIARLKEGGVKDHTGADEMYVGWAPGTTQGWMPKGTGKFLPKQARFDLELHYTTCGTEETDETEVALYLLKDKPATRFESVPVFNATFEIPPGSQSYEVSAMYSFTNSATLHSVTPHMHLRGRWMRFELLLPDGERKLLCSVPRYDFNWQQTYALLQPLRIPAGSWALISGGYDNSPKNPSNPDPSKEIHWGEQSWDEMFLGWYNVAWDPEPVRSAANP